MKKRDFNKITVKELLKQRTEIDTHFATSILNVSDSTVRRIFSELVADGVAIRTFGGIRTADIANREYFFDRHETAFIDAKRSIAAVASTLIEDGDIVFLDSGTTTLQLAHIIVAKIEKGEFKDLRVVTNSLAHLHVLASHCKVTLIGGDFREKRQDFVGYSSYLALMNMNFSISFLGTDGFSVKNGFSTTDEGTAQYASAIIERSRKLVMLFDASKLESPSFITYAKVSNADIIITNGILNKEQLKVLKASGTKYLYCNEEQQAKSAEEKAN